ncbi:PLP-dependent aminotransferase family protein [Roseomonas terrae]|uniref:PLP-dependent aminotransferase family protein n=1 Tax=Neoroseomonas terrae TaxID=424799 RepID=A0ABS5EHQ7_9PROT|nr:PLP-dependent aminotransferase family protein [Neoroseomonas terrae]MBR0650543.1 PLP-dependent aminotransferase family protein [Neoroseomonas terrae]
MPTNRESRAAVLDVPLRLDGPGSQSARVHAGLRAAILEGRLAAGLRLPSSRGLADQLGVRRNAVVVAYEQLLSDGLAEARVGDGTYVAAQVPRGPAAPDPVPAPPPPSGRGPFAVGCTTADPIVLRQLGRALRNRVVRADPADLGYGDPRGHPALRRAIAAHLAATRGFACDPSRIIVTSGTQQGLRFCAEVLLHAGDAVWMEDPGYPTARRTLEALGARLVPVPVDAAGIDVAAGRAREPGARLAYVTPSHQFPTGVTMSMARRLALLDWAQAEGAWVIEDDYDSEFRFAGAPLTALAGIDGQGRVIYLGTFSKTLFPGLRIGFVVVPAALMDRVVAARAVLDRFPSPLIGGALAEVMESGDFAAHLRRMRTQYRAARDLVVTTLLRESSGRLAITVPDHGLHLLATLPEGLRPGAAREIQAAAKVEGWLLSETRLVPDGPDGFVIGYSGHDDAALMTAARRLGAAVKRAVG